MLVWIPALWCATMAAGAAPPEPLRLLVSPEARTWSLQERVGKDYRTLLHDARPRVWRADGSEVRWTTMRRAPDGLSFTLEGPDLSLKVLARWLNTGRLPATLALLPVVYAKRDGVRLREVRVMDGASLPTVLSDAVAYTEGFQARSRSTTGPLTDAPIASWWVTGLHSRRHSCVAGYLSSVLGANSWQVSRAGEMARISDRSDLRSMGAPRVADGTPLDALYLSWGKGPSEMLAEYAAGARAFTQVMDPSPDFTPQPIPAGWSTGEAFRNEGTQEQLAASLEAARRLFGNQRGHLIRLGDGYQTAAGDWDTNARFPRGHRWVTNTIHAHGRKAGLWIAPFAVGENSRLFAERPDWLLKDPDGKPIAHGENPGWGGAVYALDPSLQPVRAWLRDLMRRAVREWGYDAIQLDHLALAMPDNARMAGDMTPAQAYRAAMRAMRLGAGKDTYILGGGAPLGPSIGLVNGNGVGPDAGAAWSSITDAARNAGLRQWMHNVWWQNDPGTVNLHAGLTQDQARAWAAAAALTGGPTVLGGDLTDLPDAGAALGRMVLLSNANGKAGPFGPPFARGTRATGMRVADMWVNRAPDAPAPSSAEAPVADPPRVWRLGSEASPARITVAALFEWGDASRPVNVTPATLGAVSQGKRAHVWDVWEARYLGSTTTSLPLEIAPTSCRLLAIAPDVGYPQLLGTDADITAGAGTIPGVSWDAKYRVLRGRSRTIPGTPFHIAFTVPKGYGLFRLDAPGAAVERLPSEPGSALFRLTPEGHQATWTARYTQ